MTVGWCPDSRGVYGVDTEGGRGAIYRLTEGGGGIRFVDVKDVGSATSEEEGEGFRQGPGGHRDLGFCPAVSFDDLGKVAVLGERGYEKGDYVTIYDYQSPPRAGRNQTGTLERNESGTTTPLLQFPLPPAISVSQITLLPTTLLSISSPLSPLHSPHIFVHSSLTGTFLKSLTISSIPSPLKFCHQPPNSLPNGPLQTTLAFTHHSGDNVILINKETYNVSTVCRHHVGEVAGKGETSELGGVGSWAKETDFRQYFECLPGLGGSGRRRERKGLGGKDVTDLVEEFATREKEGGGGGLFFDTDGYSNEKKVQRLSVRGKCEEVIVRELVEGKFGRSTLRRKQDGQEDVGQEDEVQEGKHPENDKAPDVDAVAQTELGGGQKIPGFCPPIDTSASPFHPSMPVAGNGSPFSAIGTTPSFSPISGSPQHFRNKLHYTTVFTPAIIPAAPPNPSEKQKRVTRLLHSSSGRYLSTMTSSSPLTVWIWDTNSLGLAAVTTFKFPVVSMSWGSTSFGYGEDDDVIQGEDILAFTTGDEGKIWFWQRELGVSEKTTRFIKKEKINGVEWAGPGICIARGGEHWESVVVQ